MANESTRLSVTKINPTRFDQDVTVVTNGSTLNGSNVVEVSYLVASFTTAESKQRLLLALQAIIARIEKGDWPAATYTPS